MKPTVDRRSWIILALLFTSSLLNYFDRQTLSVLKPLIKADFQLTDVGYSHLITVFMAAYIVMYLFSGRLVDRVGSRGSMLVFVGVWSAATFCTGFVRNVWQLGVCRLVLGAAEPGNFPAGHRALAGHFPAGLRGFAISVFSAGSAIGSIVAPPLIALVAIHYGWRAAFWIPGALGLLWMAAWWHWYREPITPPEERVPRVAWSVLLRRRALWGLLLGKLLSDPVWYFYLFWIPGYFQEKLGLTLVQAGAIGWIPFLVADVGGIGAGMISDRLVRRGATPVSARLRVLVGSACLAPLGLLAMHMPTTAGVLLIFSIAAAVCCTWLFNTATLAADLFPRNELGSALGLIGSAGALGGLIFNSQIGGVVERVGYGPVFIVAALLHPLAAIMLALFVRPAGAARP